MTVPPLQSVMVHKLVGCTNAADDIRQVLNERGNLTAGQRLDGPGVELIVGACQPAKGRYNLQNTAVTVGDTPLKVFEKIRVLPYKDTFAYNYDHMYHDHLVPYFQHEQIGEMSEGFDFSHNGVRFQVIGVEPAKSFGVVGQATTVFYEGPPIDRKVCERVQLLPYEDGLPERYRPTKLTLNEKGLLSDYLKPYFEQRSAQVATGDALEINGARFKVIATRPSDGGGVGKDTELVCQGVALRENFGAKSAASKAKAKPGAKAKAQAHACNTSESAGEGQGQCSVS